MEVSIGTGHVEVNDGGRVVIQEEVDDHHLLSPECGRKSVHTVHSTLVEEAHDVDASRLSDDADVLGFDHHGVNHAADGVDVVFAAGFSPDLVGKPGSYHRAFGTSEKSFASLAKFVVGALLADGRHIVGGKKS